MNKDELLRHDKYESANLGAVYKWILNELDYESFTKLAQLRCAENGRPFTYFYRTRAEKDTPKAREDYLEYLAYKLLQNVSTPGVRLRD